MLYVLKSALKDDVSHGKYPKINTRTGCHVYAPMRIGEYDRVRGKIHKVPVRKIAVVQSGLTLCGTVVSLVAPKAHLSLLDVDTGKMSAYCWRVVELLLVKLN